MPPSSRRRGRRLGSRVTADGERGPAPRAAPALRVPVLTFAPRRRPLRAPPPRRRRRPRQHPRAGASLGGAQLAGVHHRGSPARGGGAERGGAGPFARPPGSLPLARGVAGLEDTRKTRPITRDSGGELLPPPAPGVPLPPGCLCPPRSPGCGIPEATAPHSRALNLHSQAGHRGKGGGVAPREEGQRERGNCYFHGRVLQCIFIPERTLALQVFAPLG